MTTASPEDRIGKWEHRNATCWFCRDDKLHRKPYGEVAPWECGEYVDDGTWQPTDHTPNLAAELVREREREAGAVRGNGHAALPELPGWQRSYPDGWSEDSIEMYRHSSGAGIWRIGSETRWRVEEAERRGGVLTEITNRAEAAAAALGYAVHTDDFGEGWAWSSAASGCGPFDSAEAAALDALRHAERTRATAAPAPRGGWAAVATEAAGALRAVAAHAQQQRAAESRAMLEAAGIDVGGRPSADDALAHSVAHDCIAAIEEPIDCPDTWIEIARDIVSSAFATVRQQERERMQAEIAELKCDLHECAQDYARETESLLSERDQLRTELAEVQEAHKEACAELRRVLRERDALKRENARLAGEVQHLDKLARENCDVGLRFKAEAERLKRELAALRGNGYQGGESD